MEYRKAFNRLKGFFGRKAIEEKTIEERDYHPSFNDCVHHWNWARKGQCPRCARGAVAGINWSLIDKETFDRLKPLLKSARESDD